MERLVQASAARDTKHQECLIGLTSQEMMRRRLAKTIVVHAQALGLLHAFLGSSGKLSLAARLSVLALMRQGKKNDGGRQRTPPTLPMAKTDRYLPRQDI